MAYGLIKRFWGNKMSSPPVFARKWGTFFITQFKFCATARNQKWHARSKILVARLYNVASKFLVCFEQSIKDFMVDIFYNATLLRRCSGCDSYTRKNSVNLYQWSDDPRYARLWMSAVKNTWSDFTEPMNSTRLCSAHFMEDCFEAQNQ